MITVTGRLRSPDAALLPGYRIHAVFDERMPIEGATDPVFATASRTTSVADDGAFSFEVPDKEAWTPPLRLIVIAPNGAVADRRELSQDDLATPIEIDVPPVDPTRVRPSDDPTRGQRVRLTGRVLDVQGRAAPEGLLVVLWGVIKPAAGEEPAPARPLLVSETTASGYFSELWPSELLASAFAIVAGGVPVPVSLVDERMPQTVVVVLDQLPAPPPKREAGDDCDCEAPAPPRGPDALDLARSPAFAADLGGGCVELTVPNRTLEEVSFHAVVRTTQPEIKGLTIPDPDAVPGRLVSALADLVSLRARAVLDETRRFTPAGPIMRERTADAIGPLDDGVGDAPAGRLSDVTGVLRPVRDFSRIRDVADAAAIEREALAIEVLELRQQAKQPLRLQPDVAADLARTPEALSPSVLLAAEKASRMDVTRRLVDRVARPEQRPGRIVLGEGAQLDWDETPTVFQATTIAHGHLLTFKQVWRADGYSLGDLLYSLPLAPGQIKQIATVDWDREDGTRRDSSRIATETLTADIAHDRDISEIITSSLTEKIRARSKASVRSASTAIGGFIGPVVFGAAGGVGSASSTASQESFRDVSGTMLNRARDRTTQAASAVRSQRITVVQTARQGESVRAQTEVVANYNHCHAMTVEYFEVLRHFLVSNELAAVQECLFVPFELTPFAAAKALRWREPLGRFLRDARLADGFAALDRQARQWADTGTPPGRYADELVHDIDGELWMAFTLPRPADAEDGAFVEANWSFYQPFLPASPRATFDRFLGLHDQAGRNRVWAERLVPYVADRLVNQLQLSTILGSAGTPIALDPSLVSRFAQDTPLLVSIRPRDPIGGVTRAQIQRVQLSLNATLPPGGRVVLRSGTLRYRTDSLHGYLFSNYRIDNDLGGADAAEIDTPLSRQEKRNPRREDVRLGDRLVDHLNSHLAFYHEALLRTLHPSRIYLLLDGFKAPNAGGRSVASVVEHRLIGVIGNSLVFPVAPGVRLDPTYEFAARTQAALIDLYATDAAAPFRVSVPTKGVFAEAVLGHCNSCETQDDARFWRWHESPIPDSPAPITDVSTASRRQPPPSLAVGDFAAPLVGLQTAPAAPAPTGLEAALGVLGTPNLFNDLMRIAGNQANASAALDATMQSAQKLAVQGAELAQQRFAQKEMDRTIERIKKARENKLLTTDEARTLTSDVFKKALGIKAQEQPASETPAVKKAIDRVATSRSGRLKVENTHGTVEVRTGEEAEGTAAIDVAVDPKVIPIDQGTRDVCWAAAGAMLYSWRRRQSFTMETAADALGGDWRVRLDAGQALTVNELEAYAAALGLAQEGPASYLPKGFARLMRLHGPLWVIGDDAIENNEMSHVRLAVAMKGDGTPDGTIVTFVDPLGGIRDTEKWAEFTRRMEATDPVAVGLGVYHF